jgi:hypothetical protein
MEQVNVLTIVCTVICIITGLISIVVVIRNSGKKEGGNDKTMEQLLNTVKALPCVKDPNYMLSAGELKGIVNSLAEQFRQISHNLSQVNQRLDNWIDKSK